MNIESIVAQLAFLYNESLYIKFENKDIQNPRVIEVMKYFVNNFKTVEAAVAFAEKIKFYFNPTATVPFPLPADLKRIDNIAIAPEVPEFISYEKRDFKQIADDAVKDEKPLDVNKDDFSLDELWKLCNDKNQSFGRIVKTFGTDRIFEMMKKYNA